MNSMPGASIGRVLRFPGPATAVNGSDETRGDQDRGLDRATSVAVLIGVSAAVIAGATIWLLVTDPVTVANAVNEGQISPLVERLAEVIYNAIAGLLRFL